jgi:hypothetical protein
MTLGGQRPGRLPPGKCPRTLTQLSSTENTPTSRYTKAQCKALLALLLRTRLKEGGQMVVFVRFFPY